MHNSIVNEDVESIIKNDLPWNDIKGATVLIAGANSFFSRYIIETLLRLNDKWGKKIKVIAIARNKQKAKKTFRVHKKRKDLEFIFQDICDPIRLKKSNKINYIIHAASEANPAKYKKDPIGTIQANTIGTLNLLKIANRKHFKRFLYLSSGAVCGRVDDKNMPIKERDYGYLDPLDVSSCYCESKRMGENICSSWSAQYQTPFNTARISYIYGPGMGLNDERVIHSFISSAVKNKDIIMKSDGSATRSFVYIADAVSALFYILLKGKSGEAYNVGGEQETSILFLANTIALLSSDKDIKVIKDLKGARKEYQKSAIHRSWFDLTKIKSLGWKQNIGLKQGIQRTIKSYYETK